MTIDDVCAALDDLGLPWANTKFEKDDIVPPFIIVVADEEDDTFADDVNWLGEMNYTLYLVTENRDYALERTVKAMLQELEVAYRMGVEPVDDENIVQAWFSFATED